MTYTDPPLPVPRPKLPQGWLLFRGLAVLVMLAVMGCSISGSEIAAAQAFCEKHGGVLEVRVDTPVFRCIDGAKGLTK